MAAFKVSAFAMNDCAVLVGEQHHMMVEYFTVILSGAYQAAAGSFRFHRVASFHPVGYINIMDMLFGNVIAAQPVEVIPVPHLVFHFGLSCLSWADPHPAAVPEYLSAYHIANRSVVQTLDGFPVIELVVTLQAYHHIQFLPFGFFRGSQHLPDTR